MFHLFNPRQGLWQTSFCIIVSDWLRFLPRHAIIIISSSDTPTTGPANWAHENCHSNCHGNKKEKKHMVAVPASLPPWYLTTQWEMFLFVAGQGLQRWGCPPVFYNRPDRKLWHQQNDSGKAAWQSSEELKCICIINNSVHAFFKLRQN